MDQNQPLDVTALFGDDWEFAQGPVEIIEEFRVGCQETRSRGLPPEACGNCLGDYGEQLTEQGFTADEAIALLVGPERPRPKLNRKPKRN